ncbi:MAG TPA: hypothetical protein VLT36_06780 [Candidatus Dormibacteraeota bacterium]|nr:hypothetical protein [Candidatus Dormibacteraeota bacterium]
MKLLARRIAQGTIVLVLLALGVGGYLFHARKEWALADYQKQLRAKGERLSLAELTPQQVRPEQNSVRTFRDAYSNFWLKRPHREDVLETNPPVAMRMVAGGKALVGAMQSDLREDGTNTWREAEEALGEKEDSLELLEQLIEQPTLDFRLDYGQGFNLLLPHLSQLKQCCNYLKYAAVCDLHRGDAVAATKRIRTMLAIVAGTADERLVISQLVRFANMHIALTANWELLQSPAVTEEQLAVLQKDWGELEFLRAGENALLVERAMTEQTAEKIKSSSAQFRSVVAGMGIAGSSSSGNWLDKVGQFGADKTKETLWRYAWAAPDQLRGLQGTEAILEGVRMVQQGEAFKPALDYQVARLKELGIEAKSKVDENFLLINGQDPRYLFTQSVLAVQRFSVRLMYEEAGRNLVITAIALKRYQLRHGSYPSELGNLVPDFLAAVPRDPVDGRPLRFKLRDSAGFLLYSIGEDGIDNGGDPTPPSTTKEFPWLRGRDQVWPTPASAEEISSFRKRKR